MAMLLSHDQSKDYIITTFAKSGKKRWCQGKVTFGKKKHPFRVFFVTNYQRNSSSSSFKVAYKPVDGNIHTVYNQYIYIQRISAVLNAPKNSFSQTESQRESLVKFLESHMGSFWIPRFSALFQLYKLVFKKKNTNPGK